MENLLLVISGPSGVGKGTIVKKLLNGGNFALSVSCTTREMRPGEKHGVSYFFISDKQFEEEIEKGGFLEYSNHFNHYYGTPKKFVEEKLKTHNVILEIEVDGALQVKKSYPQAKLFMVLPPDENALRSRLKKRNSESDGEIEKRIKRRDYELSKKDEYDYVLINDDLEECVKNIREIINKLKQN